MDVLATLPAWVKVLGAFLAGGVLVALNIGWLLQARAFLEGQKRRYEQQQAANKRAAERAVETARSARGRH